MVSENGGVEVERFEILDGRPAKVAYRDGRATCAFYNNSCFWSAADSDAYEKQLKGEGVITRNIGAPDFATFLNFRYPEGAQDE